MYQLVPVVYVSILNKVLTEWQYIRSGPYIIANFTTFENFNGCRKLALSESEPTTIYIVNAQ